MPIYAYISFFNLIIATLLGVTLLSFNIRHAGHRRLAYVNFAIALWALGYWLWQSATNFADALFWVRILTIGSILIPSLFFYWVTTFLTETKRFTKFILISLVASIIYSVLTFTPLMISGLEPTFGFPFWPKPGIAYHFFLVFHFGGLMLFGFYRLILNLRNFSGINYQRLVIVIFGMLIGFVAGLTNFPYWYGIAIPPIGNFFIVMYPLTTTYAIIRYRFLDIEMTIELFFNRIIKIITLVGLFYLLVLLYSFYFHEPFQVVGYLIFATIAAVIVVFASEFLDNQIRKIVDRFFAYRNRELAKNKHTLQQRLIQATSFELLHTNLKTYFEKIVDAPLIALIIRQGETDQVISEDKSLTTPSLTILHQALANNYGIIVREELGRKLDERIFTSEVAALNTELIKLLETLNTNVVVPLIRKDQNTDLLLIGPKTKASAFTVQDIEAIELLQVQLPTIIENILLYEQAARFNSELQAKISQATKELRQAYEELQTVDKTKDYIIDISSHELRTPATIIKSYLWLVLAGKKGPITPEQHDALDKAFQSNERLIQLISDMLDVSKIEEGKLTLTVTEFDLKAVTSRIIDELTIKAKEKSLSLTLESPSNENFVVSSDQGKLEEVIVNLISNAIKYTQIGGVRVVLSKPATETVKVEVIDTGVGIPEKDMGKLFTKFYRTEQTLVQVPTAGGTGLGLFIAKSLVQRMGGTLIVSSEVNKGSNFSFTLPVKLTQTN